MASGNLRLQPLNHYDRHRTVCTCDDKKQASMLSGHTWNIINNRDDQEVYLQHARSDDHYIDVKTNRNTSDWFEKKKRADLDGDGIMDCVDSSNVQEVLVCPPSAGKQHAQLSARQLKQLAQSSAPGDFRSYKARREHPVATLVAPPTPMRPGDLDRKMEFQHRLRDVPQKFTPRVVEKQLWSARRAEGRIDAKPPPEHDMFRSVDQVVCESHANVWADTFANDLHAGRRGELANTGASAVAGASSIRCRHAEPARGAEERTRHSARRMEDNTSREISNWPRKHDRLQRDDPFHAKPMEQAGVSSVKYDIISNERKQFWY